MNFMFLNLLGQLPSTNSAPPRMVSHQLRRTFSTPVPNLSLALISPGFGDALIFSRHEVLVFVFILLRRRSMSRRGFGSRKCHFSLEQYIAQCAKFFSFLVPGKTICDGSQGMGAPGRSASDGRNQDEGGVQQDHQLQSALAKKAQTEAVVPLVSARRRGWCLQTSTFSGHWKVECDKSCRRQRNVLQDCAWRPRGRTPGS